MNTLPRIQVVVADITTLEVDAIVNAAKESLMGGGGVDGAIHRAAGPNLLKECKTISGGCPTGEARITLGYDLPAKHVIHTVGPVYNGAPTVIETWIAASPHNTITCSHNELSAILLTSCYESCLELAQKHNLKSIAFPAISTGIYGYPLRDATEIAVSVVMEAIDNGDYDGNVIFCCFDEKTAAVYRSVLSDYIE